MNTDLNSNLVPNLSVCLVQCLQLYVLEKDRAELRILSVFIVEMMQFGMLEHAADGSWESVILLEDHNNEVRS